MCASFLFRKPLTGRSASKESEIIAKSSALDNPVSIDNVCIGLKTVLADILAVAGDCLNVSVECTSHVKPGVS